MELNYRIFGQGPPLLILHGLFGTLDNWITLGKRWADHYTVVLIDLRNHGRSPHTDQHDYPGMAEDLREFMEHKWMYKASILGHSMGGKTAMQFALEHPDMVEKLVVVDIAPKTYPGGHELIFETLLALDLKTMDYREEADDLIKARIDDLGVRQFLLKNLSRVRGGGFRWKMNLPVLWAHYQDILGAIDGDEPFAGPTLFVRGDRSSYVLDEDLPLIQSLFPAADLVTIPDAGHWVHAEQPDELYEVVTRFLDA
ncbi:MAG: alpha/beta fold hydrolase [Lewinella sp.]|nr:alpha/beta fold hydrolase [Lewinella sp.]